MSQSDTTSDAIQRAKSYFLVNATVGNVLTFALGPKLLDGDDVPGRQDKQSSRANSLHDSDGLHNTEEGQEPDGEQNEDNASPGELTSLLPNRIQNGDHVIKKKSSQLGWRVWNRLPGWVHSVLAQLDAFLNAPMIGAILGAVIGLAPPLHRVFFNEPQNGGFFNAWLTVSIKNIGDLFAALQVVVVGVKLSSCLRKMKRGEDSGSVPKLAMTFILVVRFVLWPA